MRERDPEGYTKLICADGLDCSANDRCVKLGAVGATCKNSGDCDGRAECLSGVCAYRSGAGEACTDDADCDSYACFEGRCAYIVQCTPAGVGAPCHGAGDCQADVYCVDHHCVRDAPTDCSEQGCNAVTFCDTRLDPPKCVARIALGETCSSYGSCAQGVCNTDTKKCERGGSYSTCQSGDDCVSGTCLDGLCTAEPTCAG